MKKYYDLLSKDGKLLPCVFKSYVDGGLKANSLYKRYTCSCCGRIDVGPALENSGLDPNYTISLGNRHMSTSYDYMYVINNKLRIIIDRFCDDVLYYDIQDKGDAFVIWPKRLIIPDESNTFSRSDRCSLCKVYRSTVYGPEPIATVPTLTVGAVLLEGPQGPIPAWFVNEDLARTLKSANIKGVTLIKWA
jgi:hypothetical protein